MINEKDKLPGPPQRRGVARNKNAAPVSLIRLLWLDPYHRDAYFSDIALT